MKYTIQYGFYIALTLIVVNIVFVDVIGVGNDFVRQFSGFSPFVILAIGLFWAMRKIKNIVYVNQWNYGQAIYVGVVMTAFVALFLASYNYIYFQFVNPDFADEMVAVTRPLMVKDKLKPEEIEKELALIRQSYLPINQIKGTFVLILLVGVVFSAIFSSILRTQDTFTQVMKPRE